MTIEVVTTSAVTGAGIGVAVIWFFRTWIGERLKNSIQHEYAIRLEGQRAQLKAEYDAHHAILQAEHQAKLETHKAQLKADADSRLAETQARYAISLETHRAELKAEYDAKLAVHAAELGARNSAQVETLKSDLQRAFVKQDLQLRYLQPRMAETLAETYGALQDVSAAVANYTRSIRFESDPSRDEQLKRVNDAFAKFRSTFFPRQIFVPEEIAQLIRGFDEEVFKRAHYFFWDVHQGESEDRRKTFFETAKFVQDQLPAMLKNVEANFRHVLGHGAFEEPAGSRPMRESGGSGGSGDKDP